MTFTRGNRKLTMDGVNIGVEQFGATLQYGLDVQTNEWSKEGQQFSKPQQKFFFNASAFKEGGG